MKKVIAFVLFILTISSVFAQTPNLDRVCDANAKDLSSLGYSTNQNIIVFFSVYLEKTDEELRLNLDCNNMKLIAVSESYDENDNVVVKTSTKNINFIYNEKTSRVSFILFNQKVIAELNNEDIIFEEDNNGEITKHEYNDKIIVTQNNFNGIKSVQLIKDGQSNEFDFEDVLFGLTNMLYPKVYFLDNANVGVHSIAYGLQSDYKLVLNEMTSLMGSL